MELLPRDLPSLAAGYYTTPLACWNGETAMHVWLPLNAPTAPLSRYDIRLHFDIKFRDIVSVATENGLPACLFRCLPTLERSVPTAGPLHVGSPESVADQAAVRGLVAIAHGLTDGPLAIAQVAERLARHGFIVVAPSFPDDMSSSSKRSLTQFGHRFLPEFGLVRAHMLEAAVAAMRATYAAVLEGRQTALIGYSIGTDTVRCVRMECPRIYIAGPGWQPSLSIDPFGQPAPGGPSLQLLASPDGLMHRSGLTLDATSEYSGYPCPEARVQMNVHELRRAVRQTGHPPHVRVEFTPFEHSNFKYPPFHELEQDAWKSLLCGVNPWSLILSKGAAVSDEVKHQRSQMCADACADWLLAVM
jgi:hypothetical protein